LENAVAQLAKSKLMKTTQAYISAVKAYRAAVGQELQIPEMKELENARAKARKTVCLAWAAAEIAKFKPEGPEHMISFVKDVKEAMDKKGVGQKFGIPLPGALYMILGKLEEKGKEILAEKAAKESEEHKP